MFFAGRYFIDPIKLILRGDNAFAQRKSHRKLIKVQRSDQHHRMRYAIEFQRDRHLVRDPIVAFKAPALPKA